MRNPVLAGQRVYLRPAEVADGDLFAEIDITEDELDIDDGPRAAFSPLATRAWFEQESTEPLPERILFAICLIENDYCIGFTGVSDINWVHRHADTFAVLRPGEFRSKGYGTEAKHLVLEFAFDHIGMHMLTSWIWERNARSVAAILKQGYQPAGTMKQEAINQGRYYDVLLFDVLRADWAAARDAWQSRLSGGER